MASINFSDHQTVVPAAWLNDVDEFVYGRLGRADTISVIAGQTLVSFPTVRYSYGTDHIKVYLNGLRLTNSDFSQVAGADPAVSHQILFNSPLVADGTLVVEVPLVDGVTDAPPDVYVFDGTADLDLTTLAGTDNATALAALVAAVPAGATIKIPTGGYRFSAVISVADKSLSFVGDGSSATVLYWPASDGVVFTNDAPRLAAKVSGITFVTGSHSLYTALSYTGVIDGSGGANDRMDLIVEDCAFIGYDRYTNTLGQDAWLTDINLLDADNVSLNNVYIAGSETAFADGWPVDNAGLTFNDATVVSMTNVNVFWKSRGLSVTGTSEGFYLDRCNFVANRFGAIFNVDNPGNQHTISNCHFSSYDRSIDIQDTTSKVAAPVITECFFLQRPGSTMTAYQNIRIGALGGVISGNTFMLSDAAIDPVAKGNESIRVLPACDSLIITNNVFYRQNICVKVDADAARTTISANTTRDDGTTILATYISDAGTGTRLLWNVGDRIASPQYSSTTTGLADFEAGSYEFKTGNNKVVCMAITPGSTTAVNYLDVVNAATGNPPFVRAVGADTNIDLQLFPKGTGRVRFGTHVGTGDVAVNGYIEVKDIGGTVRKIATVA